MFQKDYWSMDDERLTRDAVKYRQDGSYETDEATHSLGKFSLVTT